MVSLRNKLISLDSNPPSTTTVKSNIDVFRANAPVDGFVFSAAVTKYSTQSSQSLHNVIWGGSPYPISALSTMVSDLQTTAFDSLSDNFLLLKMFPGTVDWKDPAQLMEQVVQNHAAAALACRLGGAVGIFWDIEPDTTAGRQMFCYDDRPLKATYNLAAYKVAVKYWGGRLISEMQKVFPWIRIIFPFMYEQTYQYAKNHATTMNDSTDQYGLFSSFLDGVFENASYPGRIYNFYELGYPTENPSAISAGITEQANPSILYNGVNGSCVPTKRFKGTSFFKCFATFTDDPTGATFDTATDTNNEHTAADMQAIIEAAGTRVDEYHFIYNEDIQFKPTNTYPAIYLSKMRAGRATLGYDGAYDPRTLSSYKDWLRVADLALTNNTVISSITTKAGVSGTPSGSPLYKTASWATGVPCIQLAAVSSQYIAFNALSAHLTGTDIPWAIIIAVKPTSATPASNISFIGFGNSADSDTVLTCGSLTTGKFRLFDRDDAASDVSQTETTGTVTTAAQIVTFMQTGTVMTIRRSGISTDRLGISADNGLQTLDRCNYGATAGTTIASYFDGLIGDFVILAGFEPGLEHIRYVERGMSLDFGVAIAS